jgi:uncharacterized protein YecE (DUF72 family)
MSRVWVGTCSWADHHPFYPEGLPPNQRIAFYAQHFSIVEVDASFYRLMPARNFALWAERTPPGFLFDVKPFRQLTWHDRDQPPTPEVAKAFSASLRPLREAGKLGALLFQFPPWFVYHERNLAYLEGLPAQFPGDRIGIEFRHRSWLEGPHVPELLARLRAQGLVLVVADEPQVGSGSVPPLLEVTNPALAVVRFHGRNAAKWYAKVSTTGERFDYLYSPEELAAWVPKVEQLAQQAREIHLLFNNNAQDYAVRNAGQMRLALHNVPGLEVR